MSKFLTNALSPLSFAVVALAFIFIVIAGFLVWYAVRRNDEVRTIFVHRKTIFALETKRHRHVP